MTWFAPLFVLVATILGGIAYPLMRRQSGATAVSAGSLLASEAAP
jgi:hypothetical protein